MSETSADMSARIILIFFCTACFALAGDAEWPSWYDGNGSNGWAWLAKPISTNQVELLVGTPKTNATLLVIAVRNIGKSTLDPMDHLWGNVFPFGTAFCQAPDGQVLKRRIPPPSGWFWGSMPSVRPGQVHHYPSSWLKVTQWFGPMAANGRYLIWWEWKRKRSNTLTLERKDKTLRNVSGNP